MRKRIKSIKGLFSQMIHYKDSKYIGESWLGLFKGSYDHYDAAGRYAGYSDPGIIADMVHHDKHGSYIGETHTGSFGQKKHYSTDHGYIGETWDGFFGDTTDFMEISDFPYGPGCDDSFDDGEW